VVLPFHRERRSALALTRLAALTSGVADAARSSGCSEARVSGPRVGRMRAFAVAPAGGVGARRRADWERFRACERGHGPGGVASRHLHARLRLLQPTEPGAALVDGRARARTRRVGVAR